MSNQFDAEHTEAHLGDVPTAFSALRFVVVMAIFVGGMWGMGEGFARDNGLFFSAGLLVSCAGVAFALWQRD